MKKLLSTVIFILSFGASAQVEGLDHLTLDEIYSRGYQVKITVNEELGLVVNPGSKLVPLRNENVRLCQLGVKANDERSRIIRNGRSFLAQSGFSGALLFDDPVVTFLDAPFGRGEIPYTLRNFKEFCSKLDFEVIEKDWSGREI